MAGNMVRRTVTAWQLLCVLYYLQIRSDGLFRSARGAFVRVLFSRPACPAFEWLAPEHITAFHMDVGVRIPRRCFDWAAVYQGEQLSLLGDLRNLAIRLIVQ